MRVGLAGHRYHITRLPALFYAVRFGRDGPAGQRESTLGLANAINLSLGAGAGGSSLNCTLLDDTRGQPPDACRTSLPSVDAAWRPMAAGIEASVRRRRVPPSMSVPGGRPGGNRRSHAARPGSLRPRAPAALQVLRSWSGTWARAPRWADHRSATVPGCSPVRIAIMP